MPNFADRLLNAIAAKGTPAMVGIDPRLDQLPAEIVKKSLGGRRGGFGAAAAALEVFGREIIDIVAPHVPAVKPQVAFFEQYGWQGVRAYQRVTAYARRRGLIVIGDVKRGDIASTAAAYAAGHLGVAEILGKHLGVFGSHAVTLNAYLGTDAVAPFLEACREFDAGLFILVRTSNPSAAELQHLTCDGRPLYLHVADLVRKWGEGLIGEQGYSSVGAVVGATSGSAMAEARRALPKAIILVPGYGAQGSGAADLAAAFNPDGRGAIVNSSRDIIFAWTRAPFKDAFSPERWREAVEASVKAMRADLTSVLPKS